MSSIVMDLNKELSDLKMQHRRIEDELTSLQANISSKKQEIARAEENALQDIRSSGSSKITKAAKPWAHTVEPLTRGESPTEGDILQYDNKNGTSSICRVKKVSPKGFAKEDGNIVKGKFVPTNIPNSVNRDHFSLKRKLYKVQTYKTMKTRLQEIITRDWNDEEFAAKDIYDRYGDSLQHHSDGNILSIIRSTISILKKEGFIKSTSPAHYTTTGIERVPKVN